MINKLKDDFLRTHEAYANDINNFVNYLNEHRVPPSRFDNDTTIRGMPIADIHNALKYYISNQTIKKKNPARKFMISVGQLLEYIYSVEPDLRNETLYKQLGAPPNREGSYTRLCNEFLSEKCPELEDSESPDALSLETVILLNKKCNEAIKKHADIVVFERIAHRNAVAALCVRLILTLGLSYRVARTIKMDDYDSKNHIITINGYKMVLPLKLSSQLSRYISLIKNQEFENDPEYLFIDIDGSQWGKKTPHSGIPNFLRTQVNWDDTDDDTNAGVTRICKYALSQLLASGLGDSFLADMTGVSIRTIQSCYNSEQVKWFSYINSKLYNSEFYKLDCSDYLIQMDETTSD